MDMEEFKNSDQSRLSMLVIGAYANFYPRNQVFIKSLIKVFKIEEINLLDKKFSSFYFIKNLVQKGVKKDFILVIQPAHKLAIWLLLYKIFTRNKIVVDAFTSIYDSFINDRRLAGRLSIKALYYYLLDLFLCLAADYLIFDTPSHKEYFENNFSIRQKTKKIILPLAVDLDYYDSIGYKRDYKIFPKDKFNLFFYGYYIPLQGVEYIVQAANLLKAEKNINFVLLGSGQMKLEIKQLCERLDLKNITFLDRVKFEDLIKYIKMSDACLGIFGSTDKAKRVIPNKVLDYLACEKITITGRNSEMEKYFNDEEDLFYVNMADEKDLAEKIKYIHENFSNLGIFFKKGKNKIKDNFTPNKILKIIKSEIR